MNDFAQWQAQTIIQTEQILQTILPAPSLMPTHLHDAMRYSTLDGGKRLRPQLVLAAAQLGHCIEAACHQAMAAVECIHVYSLVHDDMPMMDNDDLRRGKATCHVQFDEATALLVGDALQSLAFDCLSQPTLLSPQRQLRMLHTLARASGSLGMAGGQAIDLANINCDMSQAQLEHMHRLKTGALIRAAVELGALCCPDIDEATFSALDDYAGCLGLAFQVIDDVLDCEADTATLGKTAGKDEMANKPTYVKLMGLSAARQYAQQLIEQALHSIIPLGERALRLQQLAQFVIQRHY